MKLSTKAGMHITRLKFILLYTVQNKAIRIKQIAEDTGITVAYLEQSFFY